MRGLIDKQTAIDALMAWEENSVWDEECLMHRGEPYWVAPSNVIEELPSAQPQQRWIPCSERLPEIRQEVLLCDGLWYFIAEYCGEFWYIDGVFQNSEELDYDGFAWMSLPEPYKGGEHK